MHAAYMVICSIILSFAAGVWASTCGYYLCFAEHTIKEIEMEFAKVLLFFWHLLWNSPDASHSFKLNLTVVVYAVITSAIKVSEWGMSIHLSFWKTYCLRISRKRFFFFFPRHQQKNCVGSFIIAPLLSFTQTVTSLPPPRTPHTHVGEFSLPLNSSRLIMLSRTSHAWVLDGPGLPCAQWHSRDKIAEHVKYFVCKNSDGVH